MRKSKKGAYSKAVESARKDVITKTLKKCNSDVVKCAGVLAVSLCFCCLILEACSGASHSTMQGRMFYTGNYPNVELVFQNDEGTTYSIDNDIDMVTGHIEVVYDVTGYVGVYTTKSIYIYEVRIIKE